MITTEIIDQNDKQFTLSIKLDGQNEFYGRALEFGMVEYLTIEQQIQNIVDSIPVKQIIDEKPISNPNVTISDI